MSICIRCILVKGQHLSSFHCKRHSEPFVDVQGTRAVLLDTDWFQDGIILLDLRLIQIELR